MKLEILRSTPVDNIDSIEIASDYILNLFRDIANKEGIEGEFATFKKAREKRLSAIEALSDEELLGCFQRAFDVKLPNSPLSRERDSSKAHSFVKVNHGFWEMFAFVLSDNASLYRPRNINVLREQLESSNLLPFLIASIKRCMNSPNTLFMQSLTSGIGKSEDLIVGCLKNGLDPIRRGVFTGNLLQSDLSNAERDSFIDSYPLNYAYQQKELDNVLRQLPKQSAILLVAPPHLSGIGIRPEYLPHSDIKQYYLAVSPTQAMQKWELQLNNMKLALDELVETHQSVTILFQGVVLGPMLASLIEHAFVNLDILFFDFGRLLDIEVTQHTLSHTGSPLPNRSVEPTGFFKQFKTNGCCFEVLNIND